MFTVYGTAAHEFAYMGIPVVTAADNPQVAYDFNLHAKSLEEYRSYLLNADKIKINIDKSQIEEFCYMHYIHPYLKNDFEARCVDEEFAYLKLGQKVNESRFLKYYLQTETVEKDRRLRAYFDQFFGEGAAVNSKVSSYLDLSSQHNSTSTL
jgi:hypothetical protein